jgi:hypothetical protein
MAETVVKEYDLRNVIKQVESISNKTNLIEQEIAESSHKIDHVNEELSKTSKELIDLRNNFNQFIQDTKKAEALQKAATELIRVRQEVEQSFGKYKIVRETMLGVLQATDLALVKKNTISQVTEELMLSTPDYWLAPCLVAVSAWIGNDRDLANRAVAEALKRDEEKTALAMALICRRNNRTDTCYEWLSIYFAKQSADHFTESNFTYLNAYLNGVFGPDKNHMCDDYVAKWMSEIQDNAYDFENKQAEVWSKYCENFTVNLDEQFPELANCVHEYADIEAYIGRISASSQIVDNFSRMKNINIDQQKLKKDIDQTLVTLVSRYDTKEEPLRKEERYLLAVRHFDGDTSAAKTSILEADRKKTESTIDLVGQMTNVIMNNDNVRPSEKKTAYSFLSSYIRSGYEKYITEKKTAFPETITLQVDGWNATTTDGNNVDVLKSSYQQYMENKRNDRLETINVKKPQHLKIASIVIGLLGVVGIFTAFPVGVLLLIGAVYAFYKSYKMSNDIVKNTQEINADFNRKILAGKDRIDKIVCEWNMARNTVYNFETKRPYDIVA